MEFYELMSDLHPCTPCQIAMLASALGYMYISLFN